MKTLDNLKAFSLKKKQMKQVGGGSYCTDLITNYNNNHTKWSKEVQEIALDMMPVSYTHLTLPTIA